MKIVTSYTYYNSLFLLVLLLLGASNVTAQTGVGVNTTTPASTLDVNGSFSSNAAVLTSGSTLDETHSTVICNNTTDIILTLPLANTSLGRVYTIKKNNSGNVTLLASGSDNINGMSSWVVDEAKEVIKVITDGISKWNVAAQYTPVAKTSTKGGPWRQGGNVLTSVKSIGTTTGFALPFITNNTEKMRLTATGALGLGTATFDAINPEKLLVDASALSTTNVISARGDIDNYLQFNIKNNSSGTSATSDIVATADNGNETSNYIDLGINSSTYSVPTFSMTGARDGYLYCAGNDFAIGNASSGYDLKFFTNGTLDVNERMRITSTGNIGIGSPTFDAVFPEKLIIDAKTTSSVNLIKARGSINSYLQLNLQNTSSGAAASTDLIATANNGSETTNYVDIGINSSTYNVSTFDITGANDAYLYSSGNDFAIGNAIAGKVIKFFTNGITAAHERMRITGTGLVGIGITGPEQLLHVMKNTGSLDQPDAIAFIEERNADATLPSRLPTVNIVRQVPNASYVSNTLVSSGILSIGTRVPASGTLNDIAQITAGTYNTNSRIDFLTHTGLTNGDPATGTLTANMRLEGTTLYIGNLAGAATTLSCDGNGNIIRTPSDERLKTAVATITDALEKVKKMQGVSYNWIDEKQFGNADEIGFIAQELETVLPEVVRNEGSYKSVNYQIITALLAEAVKERQLAIDKRQKKIEQLMAVAKKMEAQHKLVVRKVEQATRLLDKKGFNTPVEVSAVK